MTPVACLLPSRLNGFPVDYMPDPAGGVDVAIWQDEGRNEGILVPCSDWDMVRRLIANAQRELGR